MSTDYLFIIYSLVKSVCTLRLSGESKVLSQIKEFQTPVEVEAPVAVENLVEVWESSQTKDPEFSL